MLTFEEFLDEDIDLVVELEQELEEDELSLDDFYEWVDQLTEDQITEETLELTNLILSVFLFI